MGCMERWSQVMEADTSVRGLAEDATRRWALGAGFPRRDWVSDLIFYQLRAYMVVSNTLCR